MHFDIENEARGAIMDAEARIERIESVMRRLAGRLLFILRVFLGGAAVALVKLLGAKDFFDGY